ncbi:FAD-dependent oxidoreductase [uncultured Hoeflea sp.]|uniref:NAD(P)/FAD-dependent oxidoreductase n=1 Tax=uncultured Hoeflea sp. TaxID=538666 RepID=UPI002617FB2F|nr:FAD-dependent oxidoreductase [uncultured Hoeflea sp.]
MHNTQTLIIGAGLAGLTVARSLRDAGKNVVVIDKARQPGGRMATRNSEHGDFDHGAQYLTNRTPEFSALLNPMVQSGALAAWKPSGKDSARPWWVAHPGMSNFGEHLARGLPCRFQTEAVRITREAQGFEVHAKTGDGTDIVLTAEHVIAAIPAAQASRLLMPVDAAFAALDQVEIAPCWAAMLAFERRLSEVPDLLRAEGDGVLALMVRNGSKPGRSGETFVLHATPEWSRAHIDDDSTEVAPALLEAMRRLSGLGADLPDPVHIATKRWLYALVETPLDAPFLANADNTLFACGDWCIGARIEAAHQSGMAVARHIMSLQTP